MLPSPCPSADGLTSEFVETDADASGNAIKEIGLADQNYPFAKRRATRY